MHRGSLVENERVPNFPRHPEVPAHHTTAIAACTWCAGLEGWRPRNAACSRFCIARAVAHGSRVYPRSDSLSAQVGQGRLVMARPAEEAGLAPQGDGKSESLAAAGSTVNLIGKRLKCSLGVTWNDAARPSPHRPPIVRITAREP